nr:DUF1194 domain-containing protein [Oceaniglobus trochenteri]
MAAVALALAVATPAAASCRQALVLGLDISGSVDGAEYRQQLDGLAGALVAPAVQEALLAMPGAHVDLAVFEWAGPADQRLILPWTTLDSPGSIDTATDRLRATRRQPADPSTAIGAALIFAQKLLGQRAPCWRRVVDISGDGISNTGPRPQDVATAPDITVNALVIASPGAPGGAGQPDNVGELSGYFTANVTRGPDAFVEIALGYDDYRAAIERKLLRELRVLAIGSLAGATGGPHGQTQAPINNVVAPQARPFGQTPPRGQ